MNAIANTRTEGLQFLKFEVERCIRIVVENGERCLPVDSRQVEAVLAPIALDESLDSHGVPLHLIQTESNGKTFALVAGEDDDLYVHALDCPEDDYSITFSCGEYGGVVWRVIGYLSDRPDDGIQMSTGNDEKTVRQICSVLQSMVVMHAQVKTYNDRLNAEEKTPGGDDYNNLLDILGV